MQRERKEDLSVYYFVENLFSGTNVKVVDAFPDELLTIPTVSIETELIIPIKFELGNKTRMQIRSWYIDVFAATKAQRDDMTYMILRALEDCIPVYDYDLGFPPVVVPQLGCLDIDNVRAEWVRVLPQLVDKMHWRSTVSFTATFTDI